MLLSKTFCETVLFLSSFILHRFFGKYSPAGEQKQNSVSLKFSTTAGNCSAGQSTTYKRRIRAENC